MLSRVTCTPLFIVSCLILGVYVVKISDLLSVDYDVISNISVKSSADQQSQDESEIMDEKLRHLIWFIQISDLHLNHFSDKGRADDLKDFCKISVRTIKPSLVLASGDLTDGKTIDTYGSRQFIQEWQMYKEALVESGLLGYTKWLDLRGNHDNFDVLSVNSTENYFRTFSVQGSKHPRSYLYEHKSEHDTYAFIAVDACLEPGPRRPFNFIGLLNEKDMQALNNLKAQSQNSNYTIFFGHYPTSSILSPSPGIRHLMRNGLAYLCGHYHTLGGWAPHMYTRQKAGFLELELGDWKDNRLYRIAAIDHGLLSFIDTRHSEWPVVLITNPQNALFMDSGLESVYKILHSSHIRILVFSPSPIVKVTVKIDEGQAKDCDHVDGPLYVLYWQPKVYSKGLHDINVVAQDEEGREKAAVQSFSLDGTRMSFDLLPRILLMSHLSVAAQVGLCLSVCLAVLPLCWIRMVHHYVRVGKLARPRYRWRWIRSFMRKLWLLTTIDRLFYPIILMAVYVPLGPWFVGYIINDYLGICFAWGMFIDGAFLPGGYTFTFAVFHLWTFNIPLTYLLAQSVDFRYHSLFVSLPTSNPAFLKFLLRHIPILIFFLFNAFVTYLTLPTYGKMAFLLNPIQTWSFIGAFILWQFSLYIPEWNLRHILSIFPPLRSPNSLDDASTASLPRRTKKDNT